MSNRPQVLIFDLATDETVVREMNDEEYAEFIANKKANEEAEANAQAQAVAKAALLERLGISEQEAKLLLG